MCENEQCLNEIYARHLEGGTFVLARDCFAHGDHTRHCQGQAWHLYINEKFLPLAVKCWRSLRRGRTECKSFKERSRQTFI